MNKMKNFFKSFLFIGIIVVLCGTILQLAIYNLMDNNFFHLIISILSTAAISVGVGMIIGYVMDMTKNSTEYIDYIQNRIQDVIISRKFISDLSKESKHKIIKDCLIKNSTPRLLTEYVEYKIVKINELCEGHLRSGIDYQTTVSKKDGKVLLHTVMKYKIYKVNNSYQKIKHIFASPDSQILSLTFIDSNKKSYNVKKNMLKTEEIKQNMKETAYINEYEIPAHLKGEDSLTVNSIIEEYGHDHWALLTWMSIYPTNGISYKIICKDNLIIKEHMIFDDQRGLYNTHAEQNSKGQITEYSITCDEWTDPYTGFALVISEP